MNRVPVNDATTGREEGNPQRDDVGVFFQRGDIKRRAEHDKIYLVGSRFWKAMRTPEEATRYTFASLQRT